MSSERLTLLAVDDEREQLADLARLLRGSPLVEEVECAADGHEALRRASSGAYDAIFLDVRMPDLDGLELARVLRRFASPPQLVFVSAYDSSAVDAFELHAVDYLRKPVSRRRAEEALARVAAAVEAAGAEAPSAGAAGEVTGDLVAVADARTGATRLVPRTEILYVQAQGDFVRVVTRSGRYLIRGTLSEAERRWSASGFARVHRQYLVNLRQAREIRPRLGGTAELLLDDGSVVPIARRHLGELQRRLAL